MKYDGTNLEEVLEAHKRWISEEDGASDDDRADFSNCDLRYMDLSRAWLYGADFTNADMRRCNLAFAMMDRAILTGANWYGANIFHAFLRGAIDVPFVPFVCPDTGSFIAWKKGRYRFADGTLGDDVIIKLLIPEDAERQSNTNYECRATKALTLEIQTMDGKVLIDANTETEDCAVSPYDRVTQYHPGQIISVPKLGDDRFDHRSSGIFFYVNRQDAVDYLVGFFAPMDTTISLQELGDAFKEDEAAYIKWRFGGEAETDGDDSPEYERMSGPNTGGESA